MKAFGLAAEDKVGNGIRGQEKKSNWPEEQESGTKPEFYADGFRFDAAENCFYCPEGVRLCGLCPQSGLLSEEREKPDEACNVAGTTRRFTGARRSVKGT